MRSYYTGNWSIIFARKVSAPSGEFLGLISASLETSRLEAFFSRITQTPGDAISMLRADGVLLARYPPLDDKIGTSAVANPTLTPALPEFRRLTSVWDGRERFVATMHSRGYPLIINASTTLSAAFMRWNRQTCFLLAATTLLELGIAAVAFIGCKEVKSRLNLSNERAEKARLMIEAELALAREREKAAEDRSARDRQFRVAIETMRQGLCMFDGDEQLVVFNRRVATKLAIPLERLSLGLSLQSLIALLVEYGTVDADGATRIRHSFDAALSDPNGQSGIESLLDGRILSYALRPMTEDKGCVLTCEDVTDRHRAEQRLLHLSLHDALTDLANRTALRARVEDEARRVRPHEGSALLYVDLDGFKDINDAFGHPVGDSVLQAVADRLLRSTRSTDMVARIGGDEFVIVQSSVSHPAIAATLAARLLSALGQPFDVSGHHISIAASIGISFVQAGCGEADLFIKKADLASFEAKKDGGNCYRIFEPRFELVATAKSQLCAELKGAVANREFVVYYQPLINVRDRTICGFEALVRWQHPRRGLVAPGEFIELAEEIGLIDQIGEQVLFTACAEAVTWPSSLKIAVNLSPHQFGTQRRIAATVQEALTRSGLNPARLELEITESILLRAQDETIGILSKLKDIGVAISMDDFGAGYSSLSYLKKFSFDKVKIDQSFIHNMTPIDGIDPIIHAIMSLCKILGLRTTAEGVETEAQFNTIAREQCDEAQGFLFGRPTPASELASVIDRLSLTRESKRAAFG